MRHTLCCPHRQLPCFTLWPHVAHPAHAWESPGVGPGRRDALGRDIGLHVYSAAADGSLGSRDLSAAELEGHETPHQLAPSLPSWLVTKHQFEL